MKIGIKYLVLLLILLPSILFGQQTKERNSETKKALAFEKLNSFETLRYKLTLSRQEQTQELIISIKGSKRIMVEMIESVDQTAFILNGENMFIRTEGQIVEYNSEQVRNNIESYNLLNLLKRLFNEMDDASVDSEEKFKGKGFYSLKEMEGKGKFYLNEKTFLPTYLVETRTDKETEYEVTTKFSDWVEIDGAKLPSKLELEIHHPKNSLFETMVFSSIELNPVLSDELFRAK